MSLSPSISSHSQENANQAKPASDATQALGAVGTARKVTIDRDLSRDMIGSTQLILTFGGHSDGGVKERNDDALAARLPTNKSESYFKGAVACIADGISVSDRSHIASQMSVTQFINDYYATPEGWSVDVSASRVLKALNDWLCGQSRNNQASAMVTTFSAAVVKSKTVHVFHIGDSAIFRLRGDEMRPLTRDHNLSIGNKAAVLTAALGMDPRLNVDYSSAGLEEGDILLLATDGVTSQFSPRELSTLLAHNPETAEALDETAKVICDKAVEKGSTDNVSCGLLYVKTLPVENIDEAHRRVQSLQIPPVLKPGNKLDGMEIDKIIHTGTRSHIYAATDIETGKSVILKVPSLNFKEDPVYLDGFIREQWVGRRLDHKGVMKIHPPREDSPFLYHICEPVLGQTLREWMGDHPAPDLSKVRKIMREIVPAIRAFHRMGMVHRDLKPENIMIDDKDAIKVIDFGTVQVAGMDEISSPIIEDNVVGSVDYSAPEYVLGEVATNQADIFSLGQIIYEMICGRRPFNTNPRKNTSFANWTYTHANEVRKDVPVWVDAALEKANMPNPARRYNTLSLFLAEFTRPGTAARVRASETSLLQRNPVAFWKGLSGVLGVIIIILLGIITQA